MDNTNDFSRVRLGQRPSLAIDNTNDFSRVGLGQRVAFLFGFS